MIERQELYICVELADEAGEVLVFEESWKKVFRKLGGALDDEAFVVIAPRYDRVRGGIIYHFICFGEEWWE